jgi:hypothetical protein
VTPLAPNERDCVARYCALLADRLGADLLAVKMFGSRTIELLVVTARELSGEEQEELVEATHPFYVECGRQISPHFLCQDRLVAPRSERVRELLGRVRTEGMDVWPGPVSM